MNMQNLAKHLYHRLMNDDGGSIVSIELLLIATVGVMGLLVAMTAVRDATLSELSDVARSVQNVVQSYAVYGVAGHSASTAGSDFVDEGDHCNTGFRDRPGRITNCIQIRRVHEEGAVLRP